MPWSFNPRSPCGERPPVPLLVLTFRDNFNPRSPCGERPVLADLCSHIVHVSIHAPRAGGDGLGTVIGTGWQKFQSTLPVRGATYASVFDQKLYIFQSTLPVRGATWRPQRIASGLCISIHAPRAGSDYFIASVEVCFRFMRESRNGRLQARHLCPL